MTGPERAARVVADVALAALSTTGSIDSLQAVVLALCGALGGDAASVSRHDEDGWSVLLALCAHDAWSQMSGRRVLTSTLAELQPGVAHCFRAVHRRPFAMTDVGRRHWRSPTVAAVMGPAWVRSHQLVLPVYPGTDRRSCWAWVVGREAREFTPGDCELGRAVLPVLDAVTRHFVAAEQLAATQVLGTAVLTQRELVVLGLLAAGGRPQSIALQLALSPRTVHKHLEHLYRKLGVDNRFQALQAAAQLGLIGPGRTG